MRDTLSMEFRLLGPLEVLSHGRTLELGGQKQRALLAVLLLEANRVVSRERLIDALWEDRPTATAQKALQVYVSHLRKVLGRERVVSHPAGYSLRADPDEVDLEQFRQLVRAGRPRDALLVWRGVPLADFAQHRFAQADIARLDELHVGCLELRIALDLEEARHADLVGELEALVREHPLRERLRELLVLTLYRCGRQADALAAYQDARRTLVEGLGIEPGKPLRDLHQAVLRQDASLDSVPPAAAERSGRVFVGRKHELDQLVSGLSEAIAGQGRLFLLVGEPGIGKSRLAEELMREARARRVEVLVGRCWEASGAPAYWPWVQSLRGLEEAAPPELSALLRGEPPAEESDIDRFRLFDATAQFLRAVSKKRPLLLFVDDVHAADEPSLLLLRFLARELGGTRVLLLAACRDVDPAPGRALTEALVDVAREQHTTRIDLHGLAEAEVATYAELTNAELATAELRRSLFETTDGNPLFLGETLRLLALEGRITIPKSLREVINRRLSHLSEECNRVLIVAAVLGREFRHDVLAGLCNVTGAELLETLDEAMRSRVVSDLPDETDRSRFAHVLIRDALYAGLTSARRVRLHQLAEETLERLGGDDAELAYHATAGNNFEKAREHARRAGDKALAVLAYEEAARLYDVALTARPDDRMRCELLLSRGEAEMRAGNTAAAKNTFVDAAEVARRLGLQHALAQAAVGYGGKIVWSRAGDDERLVPLLMEGLAAVSDADEQLRARLLARLAGALRDEPNRERRDELSRQAVELARRSGDATALAHALVGRAHSITAPDTITEVDALADELCRLARTIGDREREGAGIMLRIMVACWRGERVPIGVGLDEMAWIAAELRQPVRLWEVLGARTMFALAEGRIADAGALADEAVAVGETAIPEAALPHHCMHRFALYELQGRLDEIEHSIIELAEEQSARPVFACARAYVLAKLGRPQPPLIALIDALPFDQEWLLGMSLLAEAAVGIGDSEAIAAAYARLRPWESLHAADQSEGCRGSVGRPLGLLAAALGDVAAAAAHFECALEMNARMGFRPWLAATQVEFARLLRHTGAQERAAALEAAARATYDAIGGAKITLSSHSSRGAL